jgi:predicted nucleic acid-binding protein
MTEKLFFDTYALVEVSKGNPNYIKYKEGLKILLNKLNLMEFSYFLIREGCESEIKEFLEELLRFNVEYDDKILVESAKMKFKFSKEKLSFIDCIGYNLAKKHGAKFLTGDEKFKDKDNVEFVK